MKKQPVDCLETLLETELHSQSPPNTIQKFARLAPIALGFPQEQVKANGEKGD